MEENFFLTFMMTTDDDDDDNETIMMTMMTMMTMMRTEGWPGMSDCDSQSPASGKLCPEDSCLSRLALSASSSLLWSDLHHCHHHHHLHLLLVDCVQSVPEWITMTITIMISLGTIKSLKNLKPTIIMIIIMIISGQSLETHHYHSGWSWPTLGRTGMWRGGCGKEGGIIVDYHYWL